MKESLAGHTERRGADFFGRWADDVPVGDVIPFYDAGTYHLFCLAPPSGALHFPERLRTTWRHLQSTDLVRWEQLPDALEPGPDGEPDSDGIWTGSVLRADGGYHIFYTGHVHGTKISQTVCHATSADCVVWVKDPLNPVSRPEVDRFWDQDWRDPFVFWNEDEQCYWMLISTRSRMGPAASSGAVALRTSADLMSWSATEVLYETFLTHCPECPEIFRLGDKWVMAYSRFTDRRGTVYRFADSPRGPWHAFGLDRLDGQNWYAAKSLTDDGGRRLAFGWVPDRNPAPTSKEGGWLWGGDLAVPRELVLNGTDLGIRIPQEVEPRRPQIPYVATYGQGAWASNAAGSFEVEATGHFGYCLLDPADPVGEYVLSMSVSWTSGTAIVGVCVQASQRLDRGAAILCYPGENRVIAVDLGSSPPLSDGSGEAERPAADYAPIVEGKLTWLSGQNVPLRIIVRNDIVEAFVGDRACLTYRLTSREAGQVALLIQDGSASFTNVSGQIIA